MKRVSIGLLIRNQALRYGLDPLLIAAVIEQESKGNIYATRYEPKFFQKYIQPKNRQDLPGYIPDSLPTLDTERRLRSMSFGLMQVMGETMRERGFDADYLTELFDPETNLEWGCGFLKHLIEKHGDAKSALLAWNGGGDPQYANKVFAHIDSGDCHRHLAI